MFCFQPPWEISQANLNVVIVRHLAISLAFSITIYLLKPNAGELEDLLRSRMRRFETRLIEMSSIKATRCPRCRRRIFVCLKLDSFLTLPLPIPLPTLDLLHSNAVLGHLRGPSHRPSHGRPSSHLTFDISPQPGSRIRRS